MGDGQQPARRIHAIDHLRVYAALTVLFGHAVHFLNETRHFRNGIPFYRQGAGAVVFLTIAAFIAAHGEGAHFGSASAGWAFTSRRMLRIVPLYWVFSTLWLVTALCWPHLIDKNRVEIGHVVSSYLFVPWPRPADGMLRPMLSLGWVLHYIAWFYVLFGLCLCLRRRAGLLVAAAVPLLLYLVGRTCDVHGTAARFCTDRCLLAFALGLGGLPVYRWLERRGVALPLPLSLLAVSACFAGTWNGIDGETVRDDACLFGGSLLIVLAGALTRPLGEGAFGRTWDVLARSSYSIYLSQPFALAAFVLVLDAAGLLGSLHLTVAIAAAMLAALAGGVLVHHAVERPLAALVQRRGEWSPLRRLAWRFPWRRAGPRAARSRTPP